MLPQINNKSILDCYEADFIEILNNPDYRESQFLDYKLSFSFLEVDRNKASKSVCEFRNDVCAFANAEGGFLIYGVADKEGVASSITGIDIDNPDKFELDIRNKLMPIMPKAPSVQIHFVKLRSGKYLVVLYVEHDYYAPYLHLEDHTNYKIYKRNGNRKDVIGYTELKNMFMQSQALERDILEFRKRRIEYYQEDELEQFMLFHIIPESFLSVRKDLFLIERQSNKSFMAVFSYAGINSLSTPCVDGLRFMNTLGDEKAIIYNTGIVEYLLPLKPFIALEDSLLYLHDIWERVDYVSQGYQSSMPEIFGNQRYFGCISIVGCKGIASEIDKNRQLETVIDRNLLVCEPVVFTKIEDSDTFYYNLRRLHLEYLLALGIKRDPLINELIREITSNHKE